MAKNTLSLQTKKPDDDAADAPTTESKYAHLLGTKQSIKLVNPGRMVHLYTNVTIDSRPTRMEVDQWLLAQLEADKVVVSED